jgi:hypothetical protein
MRWFLPVVVAAVLGSTRGASADAVAYTCSAAPNVKAILDGGACVGFIASDEKGREVQRVAKVPRMSGVILATPDGSTVAMLQTFPLAGPGPKFAAMDALIFFRGGAPVAKYTMAELVKRMDLVTASVSHVMWLDGMPRDNVLGKTLELTTSSLRKYSFEVATGKQLSADDTDEWKSCDVIAYLPETPPAPSGSVYKLPRVKFAKGSAPLPLVMRASTGVRVSSGSSLCVMLGAGGYFASKNIAAMYNTLP